MIVIFGGTGYLGEALIERLYGKPIRVVARNEGKLIALRERFPDIEILPGDIEEEWIVKKATQGATEIFHLAAMKHIGLAETHPFQCVSTNIIGTLNVLRESLKVKPKFVLFISTDKAEQVSGMYGATKLIGQGLMREAESMNPETQYRTVLYGNIIKSTGSFLTKWEEKMKKGEEILLTDPEATRFFWTRDSAVDLIFDCLEKSKDSTPYVPSMKAISMGNALKACQNKWGDTSPVKIIGLQQGENKHERIDGKWSNEVEQFTIKEFEKFL